MKHFLWAILSLAIASGIVLYVSTLPPPMFPDKITPTQLGQGQFDNIWATTMHGKDGKYIKVKVYWKKADGGHYVGFYETGSTGHSLIGDAFLEGADHIYCGSTNDKEAPMGIRSGPPTNYLLYVKNGVLVRKR